MDQPTLSLAARLRGGDAGVARDLYATYGRLMFTVAMNVLDNRTLAEDAVQQAFLQAWKSRASVDASRDVRPWLCTIVQRAAIDIGRSESLRAHEAIDESSSSREYVHEMDVESAWHVWQVREAVDALPGDERTVVRLQHLEGWSLPEIAEELRVPVGTVKSRSHRAHRRLALALGRLQEVDDG